MVNENRMDEAQDLLLKAMLMLEMYGDGRYKDSDLAFAGHSYTQRALAVLCGRTDDLPEITVRGLEIVAQELGNSAIEDAKYRSQHE